MKIYQITAFTAFCTIPVAIFVLVMALFYTHGIKHGGELENKRIMDCYMDKDFSGFAWIDDSKYFICSADIRAGKVNYNKGQ
jgi:hypothetical protein